MESPEDVSWRIKEGEDNLQLECSSDEDCLPEERQKRSRREIERLYFPPTGRVRSEDVDIKS